ncbi:MAG: hypothetical protein IAF38_07130 [Bacteroidia bacterium]|nr:hypothetical protein [Bacteroidia bacterium]
MYKNDFILRLLDEFAKFMGILSGLKREEEYKQAEVAVDEALKKFTQTDLEYLLSFEPSKLIEELVVKKKFTEDMLHVTAELLYQTALIKQSNKTEEDLLKYYIRSLALFKFLQTNQQKVFSMEVLQRVQLLEALIGE